MTRKILILGAGKIGGAIVDLLHDSGAYDIALADSNATFLKQAAGDRAKTHQIDVSDRAALTKAAQGQDAVLSALTRLNPGTNYQFDEEAWRKWYIDNHTSVNVDLRRDD